MDDAASVPPGGWLCPESRLIECGQISGEDPVETLFVSPSSGDCAGIEATVGAGPYGKGEHEIVVTNAATGTGGQYGDDGGRDGASNDGSDGSSSQLCTATLTIVDTSPPEITSTDVILWPPNHKMHRIDVDDCVSASDACDPEMQVHFEWVTSDEPASDEGGHHEPDIASFDCESVELRSERAGDGDGRVYLIGWRATDHAGNAVDGVCRVTVPHSRSRAAGEDQPVLRIDAPDSCKLGTTPTPEDGIDAGTAEPPRMDGAGASDAGGGAGGNTWGSGGSAGGGGDDGVGGWSGGTSNGGTAVDAGEAVE